MPRHRHVLVLLASVLVGVPTGPAAHAAPVFGSAVTVSGREVTEPGIDIAADGTIYVNGPGGLAVNSEGAGPSVLWRSTNGGASFVETNDLTRQGGPGGGDSDLVIAPDTGHLAWTDLWLGSSSVAANLVDQGDTWITNPVQGVIAQDRQWLAATNGGAVYHVTNQLAAGLVVSKSLDGGATYAQHVVAASVAARGGCICFAGNLVAESGTGPLGNGVGGTLTDKVGLIFPTYGGSATQGVLGGAPEGILFAKSVDGGLTWSLKTVAAPAAGMNRMSLFPVVANAGGNALVATWAENGKVAISRSFNWGDTWSAVTYISGTDSAIMPWVDARDSKVAVSYYGKTGGAWFIRYVESTDGGSTWSAPVSADPVRVKVANPCLDGINCSGDRELGDFQQVAIGPDGKANIVYVHSTESEYVVNVAFGAGFLYTNTEIRFVKQTS